MMQLAVIVFSRQNMAENEIICIGEWLCSVFDANSFLKAKGKEPLQVALGCYIVFFNASEQILKRNEISFPVESRRDDFKVRSIQQRIEFTKQSEIEKKVYYSDKFNNLTQATEKWKSLKIPTAHDTPVSWASSKDRTNCPCALTLDHETIT